MDLENGQLFEVLLIKMGQEDHILSLKAHYLICDLISLSIIWDELSYFYNVLLQDHKILNRTHRSQYYEYVNSQMQKCTQKALYEQEQYWRKQLLDLPPLLNLPTDFPRLNHKIYHCAHQQSILSAQLTQKINAYARTIKVDPFLIFVSALYLLLYLYSNQSDIVVGTPFSGRERSCGYSDSIGLFTNMLPLRMTISKEWSIHELIRNVDERMKSAYKNQDYSTLDLLNRIRSKDRFDGMPLFQVLIEKLNHSKKERLGTDTCVLSDFHDLKQERWLQIETDVAPVELIYKMYEDRKGTHISIYYWTMLYKKETITLMLEHYEYILQCLINSVSDKVSNIRLSLECHRKCVNGYKAQR